HIGVDDLGERATRLRVHDIGVVLVLDDVGGSPKAAPLRCRNDVFAAEVVVPRADDLERTLYCAGASFTAAARLAPRPAFAGCAAHDAGPRRAAFAAFADTTLVRSCRAARTTLARF